MFQSFKTKNFFIAAQSPLAGTIEDFVCMLYQQNCACVIALDQPFKQGDVYKLILTITQ
jgi:protein tyrosine phosphatase